MFIYVGASQSDSQTPISKSDQNKYIIIFAFVFTYKFS